jgi:hypothetical protein
MVEAMPGQCIANLRDDASIAVSREHRRAKTDRLDTELLMRAFSGIFRNN